MLLNRKTYSLQGPDHTIQEPSDLKTMLEGRSFGLSAAIPPIDMTTSVRGGPAPEGWAEVAVGMLSLVQEAVWSWHISGTRMHQKQYNR